MLSLQLYAVMGAMIGPLLSGLIRTVSEGKTSSLVSQVPSGVPQPHSPGSVLLGSDGHSSELVSVLLSELELTSVLLSELELVSVLLSELELVLADLLPLQLSLSLVSLKLPERSVQT